MKTGAKRIFGGFFVLAILAGAVFLRFENLNKQPYWMDEGYTVNAVISGLQNGTRDWSEILDSGRTYFCPLYCAPTKLIVSLYKNFQPIPGAASINNPADLGAVPFRLLSAIAGLLVVILFFFIAKKTFKDNRVALLAAFFTAFSYSQIAWSRQARWYTLFALFFWLALLFTYETAKQTNLKKYLLYLLGAIVATAFATLTHSLGYGLFAVIGLYLLIYSQNEIKKRHKKTIFILTGGIIAAILILEAATGFKFSRAIMSRINFYYELPYYLNFYLRNYWLLIVLSLYGFFAAKKEDKKIYWLIFFPIIGYLVALSFLTNIVHYRYLFAPIAGLFITGAAGAVSAIANLSSVFARRPKADAAISSINTPHPTLSPLGARGNNWFSALVGMALVVIFFLSGEGILTPKTFYLLESDSAKNPNRPYWGYTPQPNFNAAYDFIKNNLQKDDIVISSHPHFNKIFLNQPGYWIKYNYLGLDQVADTVKQGKEYYVGAEVINNRQELADMMDTRHGYIVFDFMSIDGRIDPAILDYINQNSTQVFSNKINTFSQIWVYKF